MLNVVRRFWKRSVPVTLKRPNEPGMTYNEVMDFLESLNSRKVRNRHYTVKIDADDLLILLEATRAAHERKIESECVKNAFEDPIKILAMWGEMDESGMGEWLEVNVAPGLNYSAIYKLERTVRTGQ
jgi:hypothetical protein